jgi:hypothetical protein
VTLNRADALTLLAWAGHLDSASYRAGSLAYEGKGVPRTTLREARAELRPCLAWLNRSRYEPDPDLEALVHKLARI